MKNLVIAGSFNQYQNWLRKNNYNPNNFHYVSNEEQLRGITGNVFLVGEYWLNKAFDSSSYAISIKTNRLKIAK